MNFLSNSWFVGIAGGIISGFIVFFITAVITNKLSKKEYYKMVEEVNLKISKMLIMSISEGKIPNPDVVGALLSSLAKRNNLLLKDINSVEETYNDLVTELFETNFIPVEKKQTLANELINTKAILKQDITIIENEISNEDVEHIKYRSTLLKYVTVLVITSATYGILVITLLDEEKLKWLLLPDGSFKILGITLATFTMVLGALALITTKITNDKRKELREKIIETSKNIR